MLRAFCLFLILTCAAGAQEPAKIIKTKLLTFALGSLPEDFKAFFKTAEEIRSFSPSQGSLSIPTDYIGPVTFVIRESEAAFTPPADGKPMPPPLAFVNLPVGADNVLVIATPDGTKVRLMAFDISTKELSNGDYKFFNFSHHNLSLIFDNQSFVMAPGSHRMVRDGKWHSEIKAFPIKIATIDANNKPKKVYSSLWEHYPVSRSLMFLFDGNRPTQSVTFRTLTVDIPPEEQPAQ
jgi:hypothetical protein